MREGRGEDEGRERKMRGGREEDGEGKMRGRTERGEEDG